MRDIAKAKTDDLQEGAFEGSQKQRSVGGRKKQHWQVPPTTRVRVRKRIRRWDGYMCVLH